MEGNGACIVCKSSQEILHQEDFSRTKVVIITIFCHDKVAHADFCASGGNTNSLRPSNAYASVN